MALSMPNLLHQTLFRSFIALFFMLLANKVHSQSDGAAGFGFGTSPFSNSTDLIFQGDANVPPGSSILRLTRTDPSSGFPVSGSTGRVLYSKPIQFWDSAGRQASFAVSMTFNITALPNIATGDGLAFFIAPVNSTIPDNSGGGNLGIFGPGESSPSLFAVEFDTYANEWDPDFRHIGIDINSRVSRNVTRFDNLVGNLVTARIFYFSTTTTIYVSASISDTEVANVSYVFDLKTILPQQVQFGLSAATGGAVATHDVNMWGSLSQVE